MCVYLTNSIKISKSTLGSKHDRIIFEVRHQLENFDFKKNSNKELVILLGNNHNKIGWIYTYYTDLLHLIRN